MKLGEVDRRALRRIAASLEQGSEHPLARALLAEAAAAGIATAPLQSFQTVAGCGVEGDIDDAHYRLGAPSWIAKFAAVDAAAIDRLARQGKTGGPLPARKACIGLIGLSAKTPGP